MNIHDNGKTTMEDLGKKLREAYQNAPDNPGILLVYLENLVKEKQLSTALDVMMHAECDLNSLPALRQIVVDIILECRDGYELMTKIQFDTPSLQLGLAKIYLQKQLFTKGLEVYKKLITEHPSFEDPLLEKSLKSNIVDFNIKKEDHRQNNRLRVISPNDPSHQPITRHQDEMMEDGASEIIDFLNEFNDEPADISPFKSDIDFSNICGMETIKSKLRRRVMTPLFKPALLDYYRRHYGGAMLLYGPPGTGKSWLMRGLAGECDGHVYKINITDILDMYIGQSEKKIAAIFKQARDKAPCILLFDEIEALSATRQFQADASHAKLVSQFLLELDHFTSHNKNIFVLATSNMPWTIDPAFFRSGRFDQVEYVGPPCDSERKQLWHYFLENRPVSNDVDIDFWAGKTTGFTGADIKNLVEMACDYALEESVSKKQRVEVAADHLTKALVDIDAHTVDTWTNEAKDTKHPYFWRKIMND